MLEKKPLLLVADDDPEILTLLSIRFSKAGFEVIEAADGMQTLKLARERRPDVLILDVMMPGKNGWEVAREVRSDEGLRQVGIVMLTAIGERMNEATSPLYGADDYCDKPFEFSDLEARVRRVLANRRKP